MRYSDGKCDNNSCPCLNVNGYCNLTACMIPVETYTNATSGYIEVLAQTNITDVGMAKAIEIYLRDHTVSELLKVVADSI